MLDQIYEQPDVIQRHFNSPLLESRLRYLNYYAEQGASKTTLRLLAGEMLVIIDYLYLDRTDGEIDVLEIEKAADRWVSRQPRHRHMQHSQAAKKVFISTATNWLRFIGRLHLQKQPPPPYLFMVEEFAQYMSSERGFSKQTVSYRCKFAEEFLRRLYENKHPLIEVSVAEVEEAIALKGREDGWARSSIRSYADSLRAFLRYAEMRGWCKTGLAAAIVSPCIFRQETLPAGPSWENVKRLIAGIGNDSPMRIRDRAIVMLIAVYGLRSSEVCRLQIENIDWEKEQIVVRQTKQGKTQLYPLSHSVGEAILRYLKEARPRSRYREIFLTAYAPIQALTNKGIYAMVCRYLRSLNIKTNRYGPHSLRHACASHLLAEGFSLKEIGDYLGHRNPESTRIYAKTDMAGLREAANLELGGLL